MGLQGRSGWRMLAGALRSIRLCRKSSTSVPSSSTSSVKGQSRMQSWCLQLRRSSLAIEVAIYRMGTGPDPKSRKMGKKMENGPHPKNGRKMAAEMEKMDPEKKSKIPFSGPFFHFDCHFSAMSGLGPLSIFFPIFPGFWLRARFPFERSVNGHFNRIKEV